MMIEEIKQKLLKKNRNFSFKTNDWERVLSQSSESPVFYSKMSVKYFIEYYRGQDLSIVIYENSEPVCIFALFAYKENHNWVISSNGTGVNGPLFIPNIAKRLRKRLEKQLQEFIYEIALILEIETISFYEESQTISSWYLMWLKKANKDFLTYHFAIDLTKSLEDIRLDFRKSYKPLVNKAYKEWEVKVCDNNIDAVFEEFRLLHIEAAGRETRQKSSWDIQKDQVKNGEAFLVTIRDDGLLIGAGLFTYSKHNGIYSVGAYKRELFDRPIGHAVQMMAIEKLKDIGCRTYHLGQKAVDMGDAKFTEKEKSISYFKEGFAGYAYSQPHIQVCFDE